jgi:hypothetical protein
MTIFKDEFANPNDPEFQKERLENAELELKMSNPNVVKQMWHDYEYKKNQAIKYFRLYEAFKISNSEDLKGSETLLKKAEKWLSKAQAVQDKFKKRNDNRNNLSSGNTPNNLTSELRNSM